MFSYFLRLQSINLSTIKSLITYENKIVQDFQAKTSYGTTKKPTQAQDNTYVLGLRFKPFQSLFTFPAQ